MNKEDITINGNECIKEIEHFNYIEYINVCTNETYRTNTPTADKVGMIFLLILIIVFIILMITIIFKMIFNDYI